MGKGEHALGATGATVNPVWRQEMLFIDWKWAPKSVWVDTDECTLQLGGETVFKVSIHSGKVSLEYGEGWQEDLAKDMQFQQLVSTHSEKLGRNVLTKGGGKGKGKVNADE